VVPILYLARQPLVLLIRVAGSWLVEADCSLRSAFAAAVDAAAEATERLGSCRERL